MVIGHKENPPEGYYEQYKLRIEQFSIDESALSNREDDSEDYRVPSAPRPKSTRKRKKNQSEQKFKHKRTAVLERWSDGVDLKLYEIRDYWKKYFLSHVPPVVKKELPAYHNYGLTRTMPIVNGGSKRTQMKQQLTYSAPKIPQRTFTYQPVTPTTSYPNSKFLKSISLIEIFSGSFQ